MESTPYTGVSQPTSNSGAIYEIEGQKCNQQLELAFGRSVRLFNMDKVSNGRFTDVGRPN